MITISNVKNNPDIVGMEVFIEPNKHPVPWTDFLIHTKDKESKRKIATEIHEQLVGNPDYINSNIVLDMNTDDNDWIYVSLMVSHECEHEQSIII